MHSQYYSGHNPRSAGVYYQATHTTSLFGSTGLKRKRSQDDRPEDTSPQAEQKVAKRLKAGEMMPQRNWEEENERHLSYSWVCLMIVSPSVYFTNRFLRRIAREGQMACTRATHYGYNHSG